MSVLAGFKPNSFTCNFLFTLFNQVFEICSKFELFNQNINKLKTIFKDYPKSFIDIYIKKYAYKVFRNKN